MFFFLILGGSNPAAWLGRPNLPGLVTGLSQWPCWVASVRDNARMLQKQVNYKSQIL